MPIHIAELPTSRRPSIPGSNPEDFKYMGGRRFHNDKNSPYVLPADEEEHDRVKFVHQISKYILQKNYSAPIEMLLCGNAEVLDIGCGPGLWSIEMATDFPNSQFTAMDISDVFPVEDLPPNLTFHRINVLNLPFPDAKFDFVFMRQIALGLTTEQWPLALKEISRVLKPGGFLELQESELEFKGMGPLMTQWYQKLVEVFSRIDIDLTISQKLHRIVAKSGDGELDVFHTFVVDLPFGPAWRTDLANLATKCCYALHSRSLKPWLCSVWKMSEDEYDQAWAEVALECNETKMTAKSRVVVAKRV